MRYKTLGMLKGGVNKDGSDIRTGIIAAPDLAPHERAPYHVTVNNNGELVRRESLLDTAEGDNGLHMFVMDGDGEMYSASKAELYHHSAFLAGRPVASAGLRRVESGVLKEIHNESGHYLPPIDYAKQILSELRRRGVNIRHVVKHWVGRKSKAQAKVMKKENAFYERIDPSMGIIKSYF